jgi:hypothetical protein
MSQIQKKLGLKDLITPSRTLVKYEEKPDIFKSIRYKDEYMNVKSLYLFSDMLICEVDKGGIKIPLQAASNDKILKNCTSVTSFTIDNLNVGIKIINLNYNTPLEIIAVNEKSQDGIILF